MENFVLSGKAKTVFRLIELKAKRAEELKRAIENINPVNEYEYNRERDGLTCCYDPRARCDKPIMVICSLIDCPVWVKLFGKTLK